MSFIWSYFLLSAASPRLKSEVSKVLERASAGRFSITGNFYFFRFGLFTSLGARSSVFRIVFYGIVFSMNILYLLLYAVKTATTQNLKKTRIDILTQIVC